VFENYIFENQDESLEQIEIRILRSLKLKGEILADLGGGYGRLSSIINNDFDKVYLVDYSKANLTKFQNIKKGKSTCAIRADFTKPLFKNNSIDVIISFRTVHHYDNPVFIKEWINYLKPGGRLLFNIDNLMNITIIYDIIKNKDKFEIPPSRMKYCLVDNGLRICFHNEKLIYKLLKEEIENKKITVETINYGLMHRRKLENFIETRFNKFYNSYIISETEKRILTPFYNFILFHITKIK